MPKEPQTSNNLRLGKRYTCSCIRFCKGVEREVSKSTYLRHAKSTAGLSSPREVEAIAADVSFFVLLWCD